MIIDSINSMNDVIEINKNLKQLSFINSNYDNIFLGTFKIKSPKSNIKNKEELKTILYNETYIMSGLFSGCSSLKYLPDISKWNIEKMKDIGAMFLGCTSLIELPDISKWNTKNIKNMNCLFYNCSSLRELPDISNWNINNVKDISALFYGCNSLDHYLIYQNGTLLM